MKKYLSVFMKSPDEEDVKTRLLARFSKEHVARFYEAFVQDTLEKLISFSCDVKVVCYLGNPPSEDLFSSKEHEVTFLPQCGPGFGERLQNYFDWSFENGAGKSIVIGADSPTLPMIYLEEAFSLLDAHEVVIGPSLDGGYYLIGMKTPHPELFEHIRWGNSSVLEETLFQSRGLKGQVALLGPWYDVDTPENLFLLKEHLHRMRQNAEVLPEKTYRLLSELEE